MEWIRENWFFLIYRLSKGEKSEMIILFGDEY